MTGTELRDVFLSSEFRQGLEEMSCYLASIMQERPIVNLLAKCLWKRKYKFRLEDQRRDLCVNGRHIEFKFNYNRCEEALAKELAACGGDLNRLCEKNVGNWSVGPKIVKDALIKSPDVFVWVICSRDLSQVKQDDLHRIRCSDAQIEYNRAHPHNSNGQHLTVVDSFLGRLNERRAFSLVKQDVQTSGDFPSTYHFRICDFAQG